MMLIDAEELERLFNEQVERGATDLFDAFDDALQDTPTVDAVPVARGEWVGTADGYADGELVYDMWTCSECGFDADGAEEKPKWRYCPNCGAKMDGGVEG